MLFLTVVIGGRSVGNLDIAYPTSVSEQSDKITPPKLSGNDKK